MAITPTPNDAFFREVDEGLRRDQVEGLFRRYGLILAGVVLLGLLAFGGYLWWQHDQQSKAGVEGEALTAALRDLGSGKGAAAQAALGKLAASPRPGYKAAARLALADIALDKRDLKGAVAGFKAIAEDEKIGRPFRDLALVRQTAAEFDTLPPAQVVARLKPLAQAGSPWFGSAGEMVAIAYLKMGKPELAGPLFAAIGKDKKAPATLRSRAIQMAEVMGIESDPKVIGAPGATGEE